MKVVVDAGHGGSDFGSSANGIVEKDYALKISNYQYDRFKKLGISVARTRSIDEDLTPEERTRRIMNAFGDSTDVIVLSNHLNSGGGDGAEIIYALRNSDRLPRIIAEEFAKSGQNVRKWYQRRLPYDPSKDYYFIIRETGQTQPLLIAYAFIDSLGNDVSQLKNKWQDLAEAVVRGIAIYGNVSYDLSLPNEIYIVLRGDSLWSIAKKFNVSVTALKQANNLTTNTLSVGQRLTIPGAAPPAETNTTYVVQPGDSLWSIATAFKVTAGDIKELNNLTTNILSAGQILKIPTTDIIVEPEPGEPPYEPLTGNTYTVQKGDSLYSIANKFGVSVSELRNLNNLTTDLLNVGQVLLIPVTGPVTPTPQPTTITYTVKSRDSLWTIANEYGTTVDELKRLNRLTSNLLSIGQPLLVPVTEGGTTPPPITYTVKSGDSLWIIASKYGITVTELMKANNLTSSTLSIGQQLIIPS